MNVLISSAAAKVLLVKAFQAAMSSSGTVSFRCWITSACAQTVQAEARVTGLFDFAESAPRSASSTPSTFAITSRKRPVPEAHLSLVMNFTMFPASSSFTALQSCPPMSMTVRAVGTSHCAPLPWQAISETASLMKVILSRP